MESTVEMNLIFYFLLNHFKPFFWKKYLNKTYKHSFLVLTIHHGLHLTFHVTLVFLNIRYELFLVIF